MTKLVEKLRQVAEWPPWASLSVETVLRRAAKLVNALLVVVLARLLAGWVAVIWWGPPSLPIGAEAASVVELIPETTTPVAQSITAISNWQLFGRRETTVSVPPSPAPAAAVPLNLRLVGVFFVEHRGNRALALIAEGGGIEHGYRVGDALPGGARLERVERDKVVVSRNGRQEVLNLPQLEEIRGRSAIDIGEAPSVEAGDSPAPSSAPPEPSLEPASLREPQLIDATALAARIRSAASPQALEEIAFASPYRQNGQFLGFRLRPGRDQQLLKQLGLNNGDVITEINGNRLQNPLQAFAMLRELQQADQVSLRVLRNGTEIPFVFSLNKAAIN